MSFDDDFRARLHELPPQWSQSILTDVPLDAYTADTVLLDLIYDDSGNLDEASATPLWKDTPAKLKSSTPIIPPLPLRSSSPPNYSRTLS